VTSSLRAALLLAVLSALFSLLAAEAALRIAAPLAGRGDELRFPVHQQIPGLRADATYERNGFGFRSVAMRTLEKPAGTLRVVVLGGSTTDEATHDTADLWSARLGRAVAPALAERGAEVEVLAYGRPGHTIVESLAFARRQLMDFAPDLVISLHGINELAWRGGPDYRYDGSSIAPDARPAFLARAEDACLDWLQLCRHARVAQNRLGIWWAMQRGRALGWQAEELPARRAEYTSLPEVAAPERPEDPSRELRDGLAALLDWSREHGVDALVLGQPTLWEPRPTEAERATYWFAIQTPQGPVRADPGWMLREMQRYNRIQGEVAAAAGFPFVDLEPGLPKDLEHFIDDCHFTLHGSQRVADLLAGVVTERLLARVASPRAGTH
jgi:hypothetical protein